MINWLSIFWIYLLSLFSHPFSADIVKITAPKTKIYPGKSAEIHIKIEVKEGYHIQAHTVTDEFLIPTTLEINGNENLIVGKQTFPKAKKFKLEGTKEDLNVYDGSFEINIVFETQKTIQKGKYAMNAKLHYQACDSKSCLFPKVIDFIIPIEIV